MSDTLESLEIEVKHGSSGAATEISKLTAQIRAMSNTLAAALPNMRMFAELLPKVGKSVGKNGGNTGEQKSPVSGFDREIIETATQVDVLRNKLYGLHDALQEAFESGNGDKAYEIRGKIIQTEKAIEKAEKSADKTKKSVSGLAKALKKAKMPLENFIASLKRIAFYRFIRSFIKDITQAFSEGLQNAYAFSSGITTEGHRFAEAMDSMKSASTQMKSQIGSAFISLLATIAPVVIQIINWVTKLADALSQLFAAFTGKTYLKATAVADKFADTMKAGGAAAKEWKNQLLGFDEINRLNEPSNGGGGGGASGLDPSQMFEDSPIAEKWLKAAEKIKEVISWIKDHMELIKGLAIAIGVALLAWKVANIIGQLLGISGALGILALGVALVTGGFAALGVGLYQFITTGELTNQTLALIVGGLLAIGAGLSLLTGSWIPLAVAGIVAAVTLVITRWDALKQKAIELQEKISSSLGNGKLEWQDFAAVVVSVLMSPYNAIVSIIEAVQTLCGWIRSAIDGLNALAESRGVGRNYNVWNDAGAWTSNFATGGFPDEGSLFFASEQGPELVGTMGGRTAVANQQEITEGIRQGVFEAVSAAMNGGNNDVNVKVYLDSREIKVGQQRLNRAWG